jgi:membrane associated rhomboid family serine protease
MSFRGAPITLCLCSTLVLGTFLAGSLPKVRQALALESAASVLAPHRAELWRLLTSSLCLCDNLVAAGVSAYLLFHLRFFERQLGSSKFGAYVTLSTLADAGARAAFLALPGGVGALGVASGPLHLIFGLLPLYIRAWAAPPRALTRHARGTARRDAPLTPPSLYAHARATLPPTHGARASRCFSLGRRHRPRPVPRCPDHSGPSAV